MSKLPQNSQVLMGKSKTGSSSVNCCVVGCTNNYRNTRGSWTNASGIIKFYSFPSRPFEQKRRELWIRNVGREKLNDGMAWEPTKHTRICSEHFVGNRKSSMEKHPSYVPILFPKQNGKAKQALTNQKCEREAFNQGLKSKTSNCVPEQQRKPHKKLITDEAYLNFAPDINVEPTNRDFSYQVNLATEKNEDLFIFDCNRYPNFEVGIQAVIGQRLGQPFQQFPHTQSVPDCPKPYDYSSIKCPEHLARVGGVSFDTFTLLLSYLDQGLNDGISTNNKLFIFLMKMKTGISNTSLGVLFNIHPTTASKIFLQTLDKLVQKTREFIHWPSKDAVSLVMPQCFNAHYPNCRAIIDCVEIKIVRPSTIDDRIFTYSHGKSIFTAKFLVAVTPSGFISFVSKCHGGRSSNGFMTNDSDFFDKLEPGDVVLGDEGLPEIKLDKNTILVLPPLVHGEKANVEEFEEARVRVCVERSIRRIKTFRILQKITHELFPHIDSIVSMCCVLANLQPPIVKNLS